jgi:hypothetical protein
MLLSPEVVEHILSFLRTDILVLKSCSQAHPLLSAPAERYLYYTMTVDTKAGGDADITELSRQLSDNPRIRNYVRILQVNISEDFASELTTMMETTLSILSSLPLLNTVTFAAKPLAAWAKIHKNFQLVLVDILQQSSVRAVHLGGLSGFPMSVLDACRHVKSLSLYNCRTFTSTDLVSIGPPLESFSIQESSDPTPFLWAMNRVANLTSLKVGPQVDFDDFSDFSRLLEACSRTLTHLELDIQNQGM